MAPRISKVRGIALNSFKTSYFCWSKIYIYWRPPIIAAAFQLWTQHWIYVCTSLETYTAELQYCLHERNHKDFSLRSTIFLGYWTLRFSKIQQTGDSAYRTNTNVASSRHLLMQKCLSVLCISLFESVENGFNTVSAPWDSWIYSKFNSSRSRTWQQER